MRSSILITIALAVACSSGKSEVDTAGSGDTGDAEEDNWWETDDTGGGDMGDTGKPDDGKPDDGDKEATEGWTGFISLESMEGIVFYSATDASGAETCGLYYELYELTAAEDCASCQFAVTSVLSEVGIETDAGGCDEVMDLEGLNLGFGHGSTELLEYEGVVYYTLLISEEGEDWEVDEDGYSAQMVDEEGEPFWTFGNK